MSPLVVLVGPPGAGKTTVGALLATRLGVGFRDTDADVEVAAGSTVAEIFVDAGEQRFRELERDAVRTALADSSGVLAIGGGAVVGAGIRAALGDHPVVFLDVDMHDAVRRVGLSRDRPLLLANPRAQLKRLLDARRPLYEEVASVTVTTGGRSPEQVADEVVAALGLGEAPAPQPGRGEAKLPEVVTGPVGGPEPRSRP